MKNEAALILGAVGSILALAVAFGVPLTTEQVDATEAATGAVLAVLPLVVGAVTRGRVYSKDTHEAEVRAAYARGQSLGYVQDRGTSSASKAEVEPLPYDGPDHLAR